MKTGRASVIKSALIVLVFACLLLASFVYGALSMRLHNRPSRVAVFLLDQARKLIPQPASKPAGIWHRSRTRDRDPALSAAEEQTAADLSALPYLQGYKAAPRATNVRVHNEQAAQDGLNFVVTGHAPSASLIDMKGKVLHEWRKDYQAVWPNRSDRVESPAVYKTYWRRALLLEDGGLLAMFMDFGMVKLDKDSKLVWSQPGRPHHDLFVEEGSGNIWVLTREVRARSGIRVELWPEPREVLEDFISILSPEGKELRRVSLIDCILNSNYAPLLEHTKGNYDLLHANTIRPILRDGHPIFKRGQVLISMRNIHTIAVVDMEQQKVTWIATGLWRYQHDPRLLESGNLLLFDNRGSAGASRAIEFDPLTQRVVWSYRARPPETFYSREAGSIQRLANGNTLLTESEAGRGFEVTPAGEIVWEYLNPNRTGEQNELIAALYDVVRVDRESCRWLAPATRTAER